MTEQYGNHSKKVNCHVKGIDQGKCSYKNKDFSMPPSTIAIWNHCNVADTGIYRGTVSKGSVVWSSNCVYFYFLIHALKANSGMEPGFIFSKVIRNSGFTGLVRYKSIRCFAFFVFSVNNLTKIEETAIDLCLKIPGIAFCYQFIL